METYYKPIYLFIIGIINFIIFALDIQFDKDFMTWMWLLISQISFMFFLINIIQILIEKNK